jgi:hypothetical protein
MVASGAHAMAASITRRGAIAAQLALAAAVLCPWIARAEVALPPPGSALRKQILDALRPTVMHEIGGEIEFVVNDLRVLQQWGYVNARPQRPGGQPIDWRATKYRRDWEQDMMSDLVLALLRRPGDSWQVIKCVIGPTDVVWEDWIKSYNLPRALFTNQ